MKAKPQNPSYYQQKTHPVIPGSIIWEDVAAAAKPGVQQSLGRVCLLGLYNIFLLEEPYFPGVLMCFLTMPEMQEVSV